MPSHNHIPGYDDDIYEDADYEGNLFSQEELMTMFGQAYNMAPAFIRWDDDETWDILPLDLNIEVTNGHVWLATMANFFFINMDFHEQAGTYLEHLDDLTTLVPELCVYEGILEEIHRYLEQADGTRWVGMFRNHIKNNMPLGKVLMEGYRYFLLEAQAVRKEITEQLNKSFFPDYGYLRDKDFSDYLNFFTEWYLVTYNKDYPVHCKPDDIALEEEKWSFIEGHPADMAHYRLARSILDDSEKRIVLAYAMMATQPKDTVRLEKPPLDNKLILPSTNDAPKLPPIKVGTDGVIVIDECDHNWMDLDGVTTCIKCEAVLRGSEEYGVHYPTRYPYDL